MSYLPDPHFITPPKDPEKFQTAVYYSDGSDLDHEVRFDEPTVIHNITLMKPAAGTFTAKKQNLSWTQQAIISGLSLGTANTSGHFSGPWVVGPGVAIHFLSQSAGESPGDVVQASIEYSRYVNK